jgi:hypothetical protein
MHVRGQTADHLRGETKNDALIRGDKNHSPINAGMSRIGNAAAEAVMRRILVVGDDRLFALSRKHDSGDSLEVATADCDTDGPAVRRRCRRKIFRPATWLGVIDECPTADRPHCCIPHLLLPPLSRRRQSKSVKSVIKRRSRETEGVFAG